MFRSVRLIILNLTKLGEKSVVLHTLSREFGRRSFIVTPGAKGGMALYLPLNILDAEAVENPKSDLWRLRNVSAVCPLTGIRENMFKNTMTLFMSEVLYRAVRSGGLEEGLFEWCEKSILTLDAMDSDFSNYHLRFLLELSAAMGFSPSVDGLLPFAGEHLEKIRLLLTESFAASMLIPMSGAERNEIAGVLLEYLGYHAECRIEARSLKVLREIFT